MILRRFTLLLWVVMLQACANGPAAGVDHLTRIFIASDSTATDYSQEADYMARRYPKTGWGQVFQPFFTAESTAQLQALGLIQGRVEVVDKAKGGRSTRSFFEEGRWRDIYESLQPGDLVLIQFGHNDQSQQKVDRYTPVAGYKEYLRLYVEQARAKGARPILLTSVNRNYPWVNGQLQNSHGDYPQAVRDLALEMKVDLIDLAQLSIDLFTAKGQAYVSEKYFMHLPRASYAGYPEGLTDDTHFQPEGAQAVAGLVFRALNQLSATPRR